jgi:hypothetical protein
MTPETSNRVKQIAHQLNAAGKDICEIPRSLAELDYSPNEVPVTI